METRYLPVVEGPMPGLPNHTGQFLLDAVQDDRGRWLISPNDSRNPAGFRDLLPRLRRGQFTARHVNSHWARRYPVSSPCTWTCDASSFS